MLDLKEAASFSDKSPYDIWQIWEEIPVYKGFIIDNLLELSLENWKRTGGRAAFVNLNGAGGTCDAVVHEIPAGSQLNPQHHMFEEVVFILKGQGATTLWNEGGRKHTMEWQRGSIFSIPLNTRFQHFNAQGKEPVRFISLSDAPIVINNYRNIDFVFNNSFVFQDRYHGNDQNWGKDGRYVEGIQKGKIWESNFVADLWSFQPKEYKERGGGNRTTLFELADNTMSAHLSQFPEGQYKKAHRHGAGAHIVMLTGSGYSFLWEEGKESERQRVNWGPMSVFVPPIQTFHQHFNPGSEPARYVALKPWGFKFKIGDMKDTGEDIKKGGAQIEFEDQDPEIHRIFTKECSLSGGKVRMPHL